MRKKTMFDELEPKIRAYREAGMDCKSIWKLIGPEWYSYESLNYYIKSRNIKSSFEGCAHCENYEEIRAINRNLKIPICNKFKLQLSGKNGRPRECIEALLREVNENKS